MVPVNFESTSWWDGLLAHSFDADKTGRCRIARRIDVPHQGGDDGDTAPKSGSGARFHAGHDVHASGGTRRTRRAAHTSRDDAAARAAGTPFISYYAPEEIVAMARDAGFATARHVTADDYAQRYFADRSDGLRPFMTEELLVATDLEVPVNVNCQFHERLVRTGPSAVRYMRHRSAEPARRPRGRSGIIGLP